MVRDRLTRTKNGFTLLELFAITLIVAILAFMGWRSYKSAKDTERESMVRINMHTAQIAANSYFNDSGGSYPPSGNDPAYLSYFPGGSCDQNGTRPGKLPVNPFTNRPEAPQSGNVSDVLQIKTHPPKYIGQAGEIFYTPIHGEDGTATGYAIQGAARDGKALSGADPTTTLVLTSPANAAQSAQ